jgi:multiple sugar transport system ATP-binding protein
MRTSLSQLHSQLGTTTVYVNHDQVEAMTLGERVAVMRDGRIQQVDIPQRLYDEPANLFVAAFIGSPAMNLIEAHMAGDSLRFGEFGIPLDQDRRPRFAEDGRVILGIRPEAFEDAAFAARGLPQIEAGVEVVEELGSDAFLYFGVDAPPVVVEEARDNPEEEETLLATETKRAFFGARVDPRTDARVGQRIQLAVDPSRFYFFSPETGESLLNGRSSRS